MRINAFGKWQFERHQERWPNHRVKPKNFFSHDVIIRGPIFCSFGVRRCQPECSDVIQQRINPHIHHMPRCIWHRNAPRKICARDWNILQSLSHSTKHFIRTLCGANESRMICKVLRQSICECTQSEIIILLGRTNQRLSTDWTLIIQFARFILGVIFLLPFVVPTFEGSKIDITCRHQPSQKLLNLRNMPRLSCSNEIVVGQTESCQNSLKFRSIFIRKRLRRDATRCRTLLNFRSMFIGPGQKENFPSDKSTSSRPNIADGRCICVTDMWSIIDVIDRGCDT